MARLFREHLIDEHEPLIDKELRPIPGTFSVFGDVFVETHGSEAYEHTLSFPLCFAS